ncbi:MAG TPA: hypothetical protein VHS28_08120, partial [Chloroflexota bacterium]|nr:hypothetical protein [Chloroflexota bacterium]
MAAIDVIVPADKSEQQPDTPMRRDRTVGWLLFAFFLALYLVTGGGHGYSPDGEFAWRMAGSLIMDPTHEYLKDSRSRSGLDQWGIMVPVLAQPLTIIGESLAPHLPQKDYVIL